MSLLRFSWVRGHSVTVACLYGPDVTVTWSPAAAVCVGQRSQRHGHRLVCVRGNIDTVASGGGSHWSVVTLSRSPAAAVCVGQRSHCRGRRRQRFAWVRGHTFAVAGGGGLRGSEVTASLSPAAAACVGPWSHRHSRWLYGSEVTPSRSPAAAAGMGKEPHLLEARSLRPAAFTSPSVLY